MTEPRHDAPNGELSRTDEEFARRTGARLRQSAGELDAATQSRLNRARQRALDEMPGKRGSGIGWWVPAGVTAAAAIVVVGVWQSGGSPDVSIEAVSATADGFADFELLLDDGDLEMIEDLEFFAWLATEDLEAAG